MKVLFTSEDGVYLDLKAAQSLFSRSSQFHEYESFDNVFSVLDSDPDSFGLLRLNDSVNGINEDVIKYLFRKKYKIFAEVYVSPEYSLFYTKELKGKDIKKIYLEHITLDLISDIRDEFSKSELIAVEDLLPILEANPIEVACITTRDFFRGLKFNLVRKKLNLREKPKVRFAVIGRAFYDLPSDEADKVIVIGSFDNKIGEKEILDSLEMDGMTCFRIEKSKAKNSNDFFIEVGFHGLLDLFQLEKISKEMNILGIIESGKVIHL